MSDAAADLATQPRCVAGSSVRSVETDLADLLESARFDPGVDVGAQKGVAAHELVLLGADRTVRVVLVLLGAGSFIGMEHRAVIPTEAAVADVLRIGAVVPSKAGSQTPQAEVLLFADSLSSGVALYLEVWALDCEVVFEADVVPSVGCHPMR